jgi:hypothetical protein
LKPLVGAELGPVIAARQPTLIGSDWAIAGVGKGNAAAPTVHPPPTRTSRREIDIYPSLKVFSGTRRFIRALVASVFGAGLKWT